ncbi:MAG: VOC family protein [Dehalococcoidia bacterium]|nr:VOC family protein [Dehalococcoidia bacterium]
MKIEKVDHIHIYVKELDKAIELFSDVLGTKFSDTIRDEENFGLKSVIDPLGLELLEGTRPESPISRHVEKRGEGIVAISFKVSNLDEAVEVLQSKGLRLVGRINLGHIREAQFHPKDAHGVMIELAEYQEEHGAARAALGKD